LKDSKMTPKTSTTEKPKTVTLIKDCGFSEDKLVGNLKIAWEYFIESEKTNTRRKSKISPQKRASKVKKLAKQLDAIDKLVKVNRPVKLSGLQDGDSIQCQKVPVDVEKYIITSAPHYVEIHNETKVFNNTLKSGIPLLIEGPKGIGKTLGIASWASKLRCPFIEFDCSEGTKKYDLQGTKTGVAGGLTPFELGFIPRILELANEFGMAVLVLEELNALTPAMQKLLNPLLDWRSGMFISEIGENFKLEEGKKLAIFATTNPASYQASNDLNEDLKSRFKIWKWNYPNVRQERKAIQWGTMDVKIQKAIMSLAKDTRKMVGKDVNYALSTRDIQKFVNDYLAYDDPSIETLKLALEMNVLGFYEEEEVRIIKSRIESSFGSDVFAMAEGEELVEVVSEDN
jgi:MoxR-like ATPase